MPQEKGLGYLNKTESCINQIFNQVAMQEIFANLTCATRMPVCSRTHKKVQFKKVSLYNKNIPGFCCCCFFQISKM